MVQNVQKMPIVTDKSLRYWFKVKTIGGLYAVSLFGQEEGNGLAIALDI